jgi:D-xylose transport system substrate-binding protein
VPSVLLKPVWVTSGNLAASVVRDGFVQVSQLCAGALRAACRRAGIEG